MVSLKGRLCGQCLDEIEASLRTEGHRDRHCTVELHDGGWRELGQLRVEPRDVRPVRFRRGQRAGVTGGDRRLKRVRATRPAELFSTLECGETTTDEELIPERAVLIEEQDGLPGRAHTCSQARCLD